MRVKLVAGNWKMNGSLGSTQALLKAILPPLAALDRARYAVCPPYPYLAAAGQALRGSNVALGAQDVCQFDDGAYTGAVSGAMLADCGCRYALVGHSERRAVFGEIDDVVAKKYAQALKHGLTPILCVGETLAEREAGTTEAVVARQLDAVIERCGLQALGQGVIAYEPVWAIGTGKNATAAEADEAHRHIRSRVRQWFGGGPAESCRILYGGSVKPENIRELIGLADVDGALVGGASLDVRTFFEIVTRAR